MNDNDFDLILDKDESIIKTLKPNKKRFLFITAFVASLFFALPAIGFLIAGSIFGVVNPHNEDNPFIFFIVIGLIILIGSIFNIFYTVYSYKKTIYAITNKRLIIKSGFIGNDFKSLDLNTIGAVSVRVDLLDKFIKPVNTGSIDFGSMSMPMHGGSSGEGGNQFFSFKHVDNPYELYKEVKEYINDSKNK